MYCRYWEGERKSFKRQNETQTGNIGNTCACVNIVESNLTLAGECQRLQTYKFQKIF